MRILAVFTRNPYTRPTGRKAVLKTIVLALTDLGHDLDLVIYDSDRAAVPHDVNVYWRTPLGLVRTIINVLWRSFLGPLSLNESAYFSSRESAYISELNSANNYDLVIADMLRTAPLAAASGRPLLIDMDDLLSERYAGYLRGNGGIDTLLGYYAERLPRWFSKFLTIVARPVLAWEARRLKKRELHWVDPAARMRQAWDVVRRHRLHSLAVVEAGSGKLVGILTLTDLLQHFEPSPSRLNLRRLTFGREMRVEGIMSAPVVSVHEDAQLADLVHLLADRRMSCLPVVDAEQRLVGMITQSDLVAGLYQNWMKRLSD